MSDGGKGSSPRPFSVSQETFADNYDKIFKKYTTEELEQERYEQEEFNRILEENKRRQAALDALVSENQRLGLYDK